MNKPTLSFSAALMLGGIAVAQAQEGPGGKMQGPSPGLDRGAVPERRGGDVERMGPRGGGGDSGRAERFDSGASGRGDGDTGAGDTTERPVRERATQNSDRPRADERGSKAERGDTSKGHDKAGRTSSDNDMKGKDRKDRAEGKNKEPREKATDKAQAEDTKSKADKSERTRAASDRDVSKPDKGQAETDKAKPADAAKRADGDRKPVDEVKKADLSGDRKDRVRSAFREMRDVKRHDKVDIDISIGIRLPRDWDFAPVPVAVVDVVPEYRGYVYAYAEDEHVICDPVTYEVVAVLPALDVPRYARGGGGAVAADRCSTSLVLSDDDRDFILRSVEMTDEARFANVTVGWSVPSDIELRTFPEPILSRHGDLAACCYFVVDEEVAIVDPREEKVVLLVEHD